MQDPDLAASELERCIRELGLRGAQIGTHVDANPHSGRIDTLNLDNAVASARLERGRATRCGDLRSSLGHARQGADAEILVAVARWYAGRNFARDLLDDFWRRLRTISESARGVCPRRRRVSIHGRPHRACVSRASGSGRDRQQRRTRENISLTKTRRALSSRRAFTWIHSFTIADALRMLLKLFGAATRCVRIGLSVSARRSAPWRTYQIDEGTLREGEDATALRNCPRIPWDWKAISKRTQERMN